MDRKRLDVVDLLKGGAIFLVVAGHSMSEYPYLNYLIYTFHMPLFFLLSGVLRGYRTVNMTGRKSFLRQLIGLLIGYGIPYVVFNLVYIALNLCLQSVVTTATVVKPSTFWTFIYHPVAHYWFLLALMMYNVVDFAVPLKARYVLGVVSALSYVYCFGCMPMGSCDNVYMKSLCFYFAYCMGLAVGGHGFSFLFDVPKKCLVFLLVAIFVLGLWLNLARIYDGILPDSRSVFSGVLKLLICLCGMLGWSSMIIVVCRVGLIKKMLMTLGASSWFIYLLHSYFTSITHACAAKIVHCASVVVVLTIVSGLLFPVCVCILAKRLTWLNAVFYPRKALAKK